MADHMPIGFDDMVRVLRVISERHQPEPMRLYRIESSWMNSPPAIKMASIEFHGSRPPWTYR